jgi:hypothetical protein
MKRVVFLLIALLPAAAALSAGEKPVCVSGSLDAGVGMVDITPTDEVTLAGSPSPKKTSLVKTRLFVRALVLSASEKKGHTRPSASHMSGLVEILG